MGHEQTFSNDLEDPDDVRRVLMTQAEDVARRLRRDRIKARGVTVKIRYGNFETITRHTMLDVPSSATEEIRRVAREVFDRWALRSYRPVRLIGMAATHLVAGPGQLELFHDGKEDRREKIDEVTDRIVDKFGKGLIRRGDTLKREPGSG
jgi:DNA polymerase-4